MKIIPFIFSILFYFNLYIPASAQSISSSEIYLQLKKLKTTASVLYIAAHPDDENNSLLPYLAKEKLYRTGYLSLTRGDGGQNLIGNEQGVELGMIRTQELLAARKIDGCEQYFSTAYEFGYSKNAKEALTIWDKEKVLSDVVWVIRKFQPDIIITRFPGDARAGHGHHAASSIIANEAFYAAADPKKFPEQFKYGVTPWQAKRILWNTFNFGGNNTTADNQLKIEVGQFNALLGESYGEIGGEARSMHKSQGEGRPKRKGSIIEYFTTTGGDTAKTDLMDGIITDWNKISNGTEINNEIDKIIANYNVAHPENSVKALVELYKKVHTLWPSSYAWLNKKLNDIQDAIINCSGLFADATTQEEFALRGDTVNVSCFINSRNYNNIIFKGVNIQGFQLDTANVLEANVNQTYSIKVKLVKPSEENETQPYWLQLPQTLGNFTVTEQNLIGKAWNDPLLTARFNFRIEDIDFYVNKPVEYKYIDPVKGEVYQPFVMIPHLSVSLSPHVLLLNLFPKNKSINSDTFFVNYQSNFSGKNIPVTLYVLQDTTKTVFENKLMNFEKNKSDRIAIPVKEFYNSKKGNAIEVAIRLSIDGKDYVYNQYFATIQYNHIPNIHYFFKDKIKFINDPIKTIGKKIGYIQGPGDRVPDAIIQMGYDIKFLNETDIKPQELKQFDAIIVGIRAYNLYEWLTDKNDILNEYVHNGGNLIVQYIKSNTVGLKKIQIGSYPFTVSTASRITEENAKVNFLLPQHSVLNYPNKITEKDFENWVQERSTYQATQIDAHFETPISMHDTGEKDSNGSLLIAPYGKGNIAYVSLTLFRQLPAGVSGSFKILANLIALPKH
ncbi:MAG: PIG-L family deacetylase [Bacteroidetes bacterium]|nr:PIG-L family deacetylase [Bacteroidota bacterium]MBS1671635.1 PIG-L family deacetylase [Bacteroidota bacterium]